ncbi:MAG: hypothetical protein V2I36_01365 [Desulfopila sp.]|jgi:hypothetical protein|nr:hypothetical protein [Desulfopila sp.]
MKTISRLPGTGIFAKQTGSNHFLPHATHKKYIRLWISRIIKEHQDVFENLTIFFITTTLFLGVSYLFLFQLAEHGW